MSGSNIRNCNNVTKKMKCFYSTTALSNILLTHATSVVCYHQHRLCPEDASITNVSTTPSAVNNTAEHPANVTAAESLREQQAAFRFIRKSEN